MNLKKKINSFLKRFNVELHGTGYLQSLAKGDFKKNEFDYFKQLFGDGQIIIYDVGANRGNTILKFLEKFSSSQIVAFETVTGLCEDLNILFSKNKNIKIQNVGISDSNKELIFYINKSIDTSSFLPSKLTGLNSDRQVKNVSQLLLPVKTIEQSCIEEKIDHIHILKLDIQGSELMALKGAEKLLRNKSIDVIYTEAYFIQQYQNQPMFADIALYLSGLGYQLQDIYNPIYGNGKIAWCDAVFVRNNL
jgi:FkbM family methyltransferase